MSNIAELLEQYDDQFTLDGALTPEPGVTAESVAYVQNLVEKASLRNGWRAEAELKELFTSTDAAFSLAHLANIQAIPQLPKVLEDLSGLMGERTVPNFLPVTLRGLIPVDGVSGAGVDAFGAAAIVPEGTPYPQVTFTGGEESFYSRLTKRGVSFAWTWESWVNDDLVGEISAMPGRILTITEKTVKAEYFDAISKATKSISATTLLDGTTVPVNAPVSAQALIAGAVEIENRKINNNPVGAISKYIVLVAPGKKRLLDYDILRFGAVREIRTGTNPVTVLAPDTAMQSLLPNVEIREFDRLSGSEWYMYPAPGTFERPVIERLKLRGYEQPELRVRGDQGFYPGGGQVGLFQGGFRADTAEMRYRHVTGAALWDDTTIIKSPGTGV